jgi:hypothetical protein
VVKPKPAKLSTRIHAIAAREALEITFPRVEGYRVDLDNDKLTVAFSDDSRLVLTPELVGPCKTRMEGIVGEGITLDTAVLDSLRPSAVSFHLAKHLLYKQFREPGQPAKMHLFYPLQRIARRWMDEGYLVCTGDTKPAMVTYKEIADQAAERIYLACQQSKSGGGQVRAILDPYTPEGSSRFVNFATTKPTYDTAPDRCHVNAAVLDSDWEAEFACVAEAHPRVLSYVTARSISGNRHNLSMRGRKGLDAGTTASTGCAINLMRAPRYGKPNHQSQPAVARDPPRLGDIGDQHGVAGVQVRRQLGHHAEAPAHRRGLEARCRCRRREAVTGRGDLRGG